MKLTLKQQAFADYYIQTGNATEAYIKAGYNKKGARFNASRMITNDNIKTYIDEKLKEKSSTRIADAEEVLQYLTSVLRGKETEEVITTVGEGNGFSAIERTKKEVTPKDRIKAAELLGKRYRLFTEKVELDGKMEVTIIDDVGAE